MIELPVGLRRVTHAVRGATALGAAMFLIFPLFFWSNMDLVRDQAQGMTGGLSLSSMLIDDRARWLGVLASLPGTAAALFALWQLWQLFGQYAAGQCFAPGTQVHLRRFAWGLLASSFITVLEPTMFTLAYTVGMPPGHQVLTVGFSTNSFLPILASAVFLAIAVVLSEASRIAEENGQFV